MTTAIANKWKNHSHATPCPICGKDDRCLYTEDGAHRCFRITGEQPGWKVMKVCRDGTCIYGPESSATTTGFGRRRCRPKVAKSVATPDWTHEVQQFQNNLTPERENELAVQLGVTSESLQALRVGIADQQDLRRLQVHGQEWQVDFPEYAFTFPEFDGELNIIGVCFRAPDGRKGAAKGSQRGLTVPAGFKSMPGPKPVVEGASDVAALLTMNIAAVGRPSNSGGADHLAVLVADQDIVVLGENDKRLVDGGKMEWPGREGAVSISHRLASAWSKPVRMALPPKTFKDVRTWLNQHCTHPDDASATASLGRQLMQQVLDDAELIQPAPPDLVFRVDRDPKRKSVTVRAVVDGKVIATDELKLTSNKKRAEFANTVAAKDKRLSPAAIEEKLHGCVNADAKDSQPETPQTREELIAQLDQQCEQALADLPSKAIRQAEDMLDDPGLIDAILNDMVAVGVVGEQELTMQVYMAGTSRLLAKPISAIVQGLSSTGKSFVIERVGSVFPDLVLLRATELSPQSLYYMPKGRLIHRWVVAGERSRRPDDDNAEATRALREMISGGRLSKAIPTKTGNMLETVLVEQEGPIAFIESTTLTNIFDEDANRCLLLGTDESPGQTARIIAATAEACRNDPPDVSAIIFKHQALQLLLRRVRVKIPFADRLAATIPVDRPEGRRAITLALSMIQAVALLHQRQRCPRELQHGDTIEATLVDYRIARRLLIGPLGRALGGALPDAVSNLCRRLLNRYGNDPFQTPRAAGEDLIIKSSAKIGEYLQTLRKAGVAELVEEGRGNKPHIWKIVGEPPEAGAKWLPDGWALERAT
jgi:hypothetical protein